MTGARAIRLRAQALEQSPCGSLWLEVADAEVCLRRSGALWLEAVRRFETRKLRSRSSA